jgi:hypothetical protein
MWMSTDDAIRMYAQFWWSRHGAQGVRSARDRARHLQALGDVEGHRVWSRLAIEIARRREEETRRH